MLAATALHSFLDGWGLAVSQQGSGFVRIAFLLGIGLHKLPEGFTVASIMLASGRDRAAARMATLFIGGATLLDRSAVQFTHAGEHRGLPGEQRQDRRHRSAGRERRARRLALLTLPMVS